MEVEEKRLPPISSPTLESFEAFIATYVKLVPEKIRVEKRLHEIREYGKNKRAKKDLPRTPERVWFCRFDVMNRLTGTM